MNWTEGSLARHSRGRGWNRDATRQKQYFAKVRARKHDMAASQDNMHPSSFVPDHVHEKHQTQSRDRLPSLALQDPINILKRPRSQRSHQRDASAGPRDALQCSTFFSTQESSNIDLDSKRRKLLDKSDWAGVDFQKPISVGFSSPRDNPNQLLTSFGQNTTQNCNGRPQRATKGKSRADNTAKKVSADRQIRIRIGDHSFRWSQASNSVRSVTSHRDPLPSFETWVSSRRGPTTLQNSSLATPRGGPLTHIPALRSRPSLASSSDSWGLRQVPSSESNDVQSSDVCISECRDQPKYVVQSSPHFIHQPQPTRGRATALFDLQSPTLDDTSSTTAQIGSLRSGNAHVTEDDHVWNSWLNSNDGDEPRNDFDARNDHAPSPSITPGPSHYLDGLDEQSHAPRGCETREERDLHIDNLGLSLAAYPSSLMDQSRNLNSVLIQCELGSSKLPQKHDGPISETRLETARPKRKVSSVWVGKNSTKARKDLMLPSKPELTNLPNVQDLMDLLMDEDGEAESNSTPVQVSEDEDEIWKRFVFDGDTAELSRRAGIEARHQTTHYMSLARADAQSDVAEPPASLRENPSRSPAPVAALESNYSENSRSPKMVLHRADPTETVVTEMTNAQSAHNGSPRLQHSDFKFHQPQLFVGRLASLPPANVDPHPALQQQQQQQMCSRPKGGGRKWQRRRRAEGWPDFRAMPNYEGDPIEEVYHDEG